MVVRFVSCSEMVVARNGGIGFLAVTEYVAVDIELFRGRG